MSDRQVANQQAHRRILWAARIALMLALAVTVAFPNWEQFKGKGMALRVPF
jgi:hypothetical protein